MNKRSSLLWKILLSLTLTLLAFAGFGLLLSTGRAHALTVDGQAAQTPTPTATLPPTPEAALPTPEGPSPHATGDCYACHSQPGMTGVTQNGETFSLFIDEEHYKDAIHSSCVFCHVNQGGYPHATSPMTSCAVCHWQASGGDAPTGPLTFELPYEDTRAISLEINASCARCHEQIYNELEGSIHTRTMTKENRFSPVCVDCHSAHNINLVNRQLGARLCSKCHLAEFIAYESSVHGSALKEENNQDVPICDDCHGAHNVIGPRDADFRLDAFEMCGKCHADARRMEKYNVSTDVLSTYLDDFHGRSSDLFGRPGAAKVTQAACYDCHGVHNILPPEDPDSKVSTANLQRTCQECHSDTSANFPQAWLSHKRPSLEDVPGLYLLNILLVASVVVAVAFFVIYILLDLRRRLTRQGKS
ncbi:MAG: cytochrome c3 family protein [Chloroflexota bacterium]